MLETNFLQDEVALVEVGHVGILGERAVEGVGRTNQRRPGHGGLHDRYGNDGVLQGHCRVQHDPRMCLGHIRRTRP